MVYNHSTVFVWCSQYVCMYVQYNYKCVCVHIECWYNVRSYAVVEWI